MPPSIIKPIRSDRAARPAFAAMLGVAGALLVACGGSSANLIPAQQAGLLEHHIQLAAEAASVGNGECAATEHAIEQAEHDVQHLPASVDRGLVSHLSRGVQDLRRRALAECEKQAHTSTPTTSTTQTTPTVTIPPPVTGPAGSTTTEEEEVQTTETLPTETTPLTTPEVEPEPPVSSVEPSGGIEVPPAGESETTTGTQAGTPGAAGAPAEGDDAVGDTGK